MIYTCYLCRYALRINEGDIIKSDGNPEYGMLTYPWYVKYVPKDASDILVVGNVKAALSGETQQDADAGSDEDCQFLLKNFIDFVRNETGKPTSFVAKGPNEDFALLANAPTMIGSISTYALWAGIANSYGNVILPNCTLFFNRGRAPHIPGVQFVDAQALRSGPAQDGDGMMGGMTVAHLLHLLQGPVSEFDRMLFWNGKGDYGDDDDS